MLLLQRSNSHLLSLDLESHRSGAFVAQIGAPTTIWYRDLDPWTPKFTSEWMSPSMPRCYMLWWLWLTKLQGTEVVEWLLCIWWANYVVSNKSRPWSICLALGQLCFVNTVSMQHVRIACWHRWNPMPTCWSTNLLLLLLLFQPMKSNSKSQKIPPRILYSACPGQELHKCLAATVWNIVKHAGMSSARLFPFCYFVIVRLLYFCIWTAATIWSKPQRHFGMSCLRFSWVQRSNSFRTLSLPSTQNHTLLARALDNLIQLAVFHQFAALGSLDRTGK